MTDDDAKAEAADRDSRDDDAMRSLLKRSIEMGAPPAPAQPDLLRGVQRKIRQRSKGKFFADGWSTTQSRVSYALVATLMLLVIAVAYFALGPIGISAH
jgi:hypothetical protein